MKDSQDNSVSLYNISDKLLCFSTVVCADLDNVLSYEGGLLVDEVDEALDAFVADPPVLRLHLVDDCIHALHRGVISAAWGSSRPVTHGIAVNSGQWQKLKSMARI